MLFALSSFTFVTKFLKELPDVYNVAFAGLVTASGLAIIHFLEKKLNSLHDRVDTIENKDKKDNE